MFYGGTTSSTHIRTWNIFKRSKLCIQFLKDVSASSSSVYGDKFVRATFNRSLSSSLCFMHFISFRFNSYRSYKRAHTLENCILFVIINKLMILNYISCMCTLFYVCFLKCACLNFSSLFQLFERNRKKQRTTN